MIYRLKYAKSESNFDADFEHPTSQGGGSTPSGGGGTSQGGDTPSAGGDNPGGGEGE